MTKESRRRLSAKLWQILMLRCLKISEGNHRSWTRALVDCGCELLPFCHIHEDTPDDFFIRDTAIGNIRVPRDVAMRMLTLGEMP